MDADTLVVDNIDELFEREEISATPDIGWPDCFNSGVFVFKPSEATFKGLVRMAETEGSFDGGDQVRYWDLWVNRLQSGPDLHKSVPSKRST